MTVMERVEQLAIDPWGEARFRRDRTWYARLASYDSSTSQQDYHLLRDRALEDASFDLFDRFMPTGRPKHDIGRYVLRHGIPVPLIRSLPEWQYAFRSGFAMLRSEMPQDYAGLSGLLSSKVFGLQIRYPKKENDREDLPQITGYSEDRTPIIDRKVEGPVEVLPEVIGRNSSIGTVAVSNTLEKLYRDGLLNGTIDPARYMRQEFWEGEHIFLQEEAISHRYRIDSLGLSYAEASHWRFIPGINVRVFRDPVIEGKYYIGGKESHHVWEVYDGRDSADVKAQDKMRWRRGDEDGPFEYTLPTRKIIDLYEKVRNLSYFDQHQAPLLEMQYGDDGRLYFLQYLKTGQVVGDPGEFPLPNGRNITRVNHVRGATSKDGERVRVYIDPSVFTVRMENQAFFSDSNLSRRNLSAQVACLVGRVVILNANLSFKDNHFNSSPLYRPPTAIGLWDDLGEGERRFEELMIQIPRDSRYERVKNVHYIDAVVTSNGRAATIDSDWELKDESIN